MQKPNSQGNQGPSFQHSTSNMKNQADQEKRLRELREQRELTRLRVEKEQWRKASQLPKVFPDIHGAKEKKVSYPDRSTFFTKLSLGKLLE